ncbi:MAG: secretin and TonB N-terminal domain-containing protein [Phycisphaerales bacterium]|nr:secretin and TonB N-terminal domain-containing protein [Phycisphaerales bacterium]
MRKDCKMVKRIGLPSKQRLKRRRTVYCVAAVVVALVALAPDPKVRAQSSPVTSDATPAGSQKNATLDASDQFVRVGNDKRVTLHFSGTPLADAIRMLSEPTQRNIILTEGVDGKVSASLYNVSFEAALEAMLVSNGLGYRMEGDFIFVYPLEKLAELEQAGRRIETRVYRLSYMNAKAVKEIVEESMLSKIGKVAITPFVEKGLGSQEPVEVNKGDEAASADMLIITDYADILDEVEKVIRQLDVRPRQVLIEATILRATLNEDNALGIDFTTVGGIDFQTLNSTSPGAQDITTGNTPQNQLGDTTFTVRTDFNAGVPAGGLTFGIIKDQVGFFIRALEQITDTDILANPKVLALNKQFGEVIVGRRDGYLTTTITETTAVQTVEFLETGTVMTFRPFIGNDGYVRMEIHPKDSTGGLTQANLPFEQTTEVTTNIMVKDGHTILIGGLFREVSTATRAQVPGLGNIPVAGALFRTTEDNTVREEVIILLTVHIIKDQADTRASAELREDVERYRVGMRSGMQQFGRERLAQAYYSWAMEHLANGRLDKALWDAQLAVHNFPRHIHAAKLIEKLREERAWESEASTIRTFVRDAILRDQGIKQPAFGRPGPPFDMPRSPTDKPGEYERAESE